MNGFFSIMVWCEIQVGMIAVVGIGLSTLVNRRSPHLAGSILATTVFVAWVLTLLAPLPIHRWIPDLTSKAISPSATSGIMHNDPRPDTTAPDIASTGSSVPMVDVGRLLSSLRAAEVQVSNLERSRNATSQIVCLTLTVLVVFGVVQLASGIGFIRSLRRRSVPVEDIALLDRLKSIAESLACRGVPEIRESREFTDAAVVGWHRPVVILPSHWRMWSVDEQRAVLTHEMAHIVRRDVVWRTIASILLSLHFHNPLLHWLFRRLTFCQELATDEIAALAVGPRDYLRALSSLALRQDELFGRGVAPNMLPVFSGQLIRRISMLRSWKNTQHRRRTILQASTCIALLALGVALAVTRGMAQQPDGETKTSAVPIRTVSLTKSVVANSPTLDPTREMFRHAPIDCSVVAANHPDGMFAARIGELLKTPEISTFVPMMNTAISQGLAAMMKTNSPPPIRLENVEWIVARPTISFRKLPAKDGDTSEPKTAMMFGAGAFAVKLTEPLDLNAWVEQYAPQAARHVIEGQNVFRWQAAAMGPQPLYVWMQDDTTLRMNYLAVEKITPETKLADLLGDASSGNRQQESSAAESNPVSWSPIWQRIDSGLVSVILARADLSGLLFDFENRKSFQAETLDAIEQALLALRSRCQMTTCSLDLSSTPSQLGLRISLVHLTHVSSRMSAEDLRRLLKRSQTFLSVIAADASTRGENAQGQKAIRNLCDLIEAATISVEDYDDQTSAVVLATTMPFSRLMEQVLADLRAE